MASDSQDPIRRSKHRRSISPDAAEPSKRHKHRHHRHRHHRRHKHDDDAAKRVEMEIEAPGVLGEEVASASRHVSNPRPESDVEEGEIVEEADDRDMGVHSASVEVGDRSSLPLEDNDNNSKDKLVKNGLIEDGENPTDGSKAHIKVVSSNGDTGLLLLNENYSESKESESRGRDKERSQSLGISEKGSPVKMSHKKDIRNSNFRHGHGDDIRDNDREYSSSYSRYRHLDRHQSREPKDSERERSRESWDKDHFGRVRGTSRSIEKMKDHGRASSRDSERKVEREREKERERDKERDRERSRARDRDRERESTRLREEREREWRKEKERERSRESGRYRSRDRGSDRDRDSGRNRSRDRNRGRDGESGRNSSRERDLERDRDGRDHRKRDLDGYEDRHTYKGSRLSRDDETDYRNRLKKNDHERPHSSKSDGLGGDKKSRRDEEEQEEYQERVALQLVDQEEDDVERIKEESRRRRQAILEKYKMQQQQQINKPELENNDKEYVGQVSQKITAPSVTPKTLAVRKEDGGSDVGDPSFIVSKSPPQDGISASGRISGAGGLGGGTPKSERSADMFCDDIFGNSPAGVRKTGKGDGLALERSSLHDNWDDAEGYYSFRFGEILDGRYEVAAAHGKGVFSTVVRAKDLKAGLGDPEEVAIKIIRNNEHMHKAGKEELVILKKLVGADPEDKRHCVRFLSSFSYRNHLCLVFESLNMNLREVLKKFGRNIGLKLTAVRLYSKQLFISLKHLRNCGVLHCDIKPDNMLVNEAKNVLKLCDFGNAMFAGKNEITPYLVSRFYRAPEIILGLPYDHPLDIWSVGCCIFELYTGKVLFPGATNNDMLRLHMELKGLFPKKMLRKGGFIEQHFDQDLNFLAIEEDPVTKKTMRRLITSIKPKDISAIVKGSPGEDPKMLANFKDLLEKIFILDPDKRLTVSQALSHPFITGK